MASSPAEPCAICGDARDCDACAYGGRIRELVDTRDDYREVVEARWKAGSHRASGWAAIDFAAKIIGCDFRRSDCHCLDKPAACLIGGFPGLVTLDHCRRCVADPASPGGPIAG